MPGFINDGDGTLNGAGLGGGGTSGGSSGSGSTSTPTEAPASLSASGAMPQPSGNVEHVLEVTRVSAGVAGRGPDFPIQFGESVEVAPKRGNAGKNYVGFGVPAAAINGPRLTFSNTDNPLTVSVRNIADLFFYGDNDADATVVIVKRTGPGA
jgi:hypothetical protein